MDAGRPCVSVIVPMRNAESFVVATLKSILSEVTVGLEVVVVNDQSTDRSVDRVLELRDPRVRIIEGSGLGISAAMNLGLDSVFGSIVMRCDADDLYPVDRIKNQVKWLESHQDFDAVCGGFSTIDCSGRHVATLETGVAAEEITEELNSGITRTTLCSYAVRRSVIDKVGGFRGFFETAEDIDFQLRLANFCRVMYLPAVDYKYRLHAASITHTQSDFRRVFFERTARELQRQRILSGVDDLQLGFPPMVPAAAMVGPSSVSRQVGGMLLGSAWRAHRGGKKGEAILLGLRALMHMPLDFSVWRNLILLVVRAGRGGGFD